MEITREQIELLQKHEVDEHTILEIIKDLADKQNASIVPGTPKAQPRKKRATKAEMEARKALQEREEAIERSEKHADIGRTTKPLPDDFDQSAVDAALANTKRHLAKSGKQTIFDPPTF